MEDEVIIGIAVAAVFVFLGAVTCVLFWWRFIRWRSSPDTRRPGTDCLFKIFKCVDTRCCPPRPPHNGTNGGIAQNESINNQQHCYINHAGAAATTDSRQTEGREKSSSNSISKRDVKFDKVREAVDIGGITLVSVEESSDSGCSEHSASRYNGDLYPEPVSPIRGSAQGYVEVDLTD